MSRETLYYEQLANGDITKEILSEKENINVQKIKESNQEILATYSVKDMQEKIFAKMNENNKTSFQDKRPKLFWPSVKRSSIIKITALAAVCCAALLIPIGLSKTNIANENISSPIYDPLESNTEHVKGNGSILHIYKKDGAEAIRLESNAHVVENDFLQISYIAAGSTYGSIISVDGNGVVTQHLPDSGKTAVELNNEGEIALEYSYQLDDAPKYERFFFITSEQPFSTRALIEELSGNKKADKTSLKSIKKFLPSNTDVTDLLLLK